MRAELEVVSDGDHPATSQGKEIQHIPLPLQPLPAQPAGQVAEATHKRQRLFKRGGHAPQEAAAPSPEDFDDLADM